MTGSIQDELDDLTIEFEVLDDWEQRFQYVIDLGRGLAPLTDDEHIDANKVQGCASQVWLVTEPTTDGTLKIRADSDSSLVRGLIAILLRLYSGHAPDDILAFDINEAFERLDLKSHLSRQRSNGVVSMVGRIRRDAEAMRARA